jgi:hypothetical protein
MCRVFTFIGKLLGQVKDTFMSVLKSWKAQIVQAWQGTWWIGRTIAGAIAAGISIFAPPVALVFSFYTIQSEGSYFFRVGIEVVFGMLLALIAIYATELLIPFVFVWTLGGMMELNVAWKESANA